MNPEFLNPSLENIFFLPSNFSPNQIQYYPMEKSSDSKSTSDQKTEYIGLLNPVKKKLYNFIFKSLNFSSEADDIFQETLLKGFKYFHAFNREKNFNTWLFTIASNLIKDHYRENKSSVLSEEVEKVNIQKNPSWEKIMDIHHAVQKLKPRHRQVFFLYYYNEFKISEISATTGLSQSNIKFVLNQSRKRLRKFLGVPE